MDDVSNNEARKATMGPTRRSRSPSFKCRGRALEACITCRSRKIRCNVLRNGEPCSNCRHNGISCSLPNTKRKTRHHDFAELESQNQESPGPKVFEEPSSNAHIDSSHIASQQRSSPMEESPYPRVKYAATMDYPEELNASENMVFDVLCQTFAEYETDRIYESGSDSTSASDPIKQALPTLSELFQGHHAVPATSKPLPPHIRSDDITYLLKKGALSVPPRDLQVVLLRSYIESVHSQFPVVDTVELKNWTRYGDIQESNPSMIVFQAVMFAGSVFANARSLKKVGFNDRAHLQKVLFNRVRLLYDFDCETDRIATIQALFLLSFVPCFLPTDKNSSHWLGLAISLCYSAGLHRNNDTERIRTQYERLKRRLWWACFTRDRSLAIAEGIPVKIQTKDCHTPMLCLEDFNLCDHDEVTVLQEVNAKLAIEKAMLCWFCSTDLIQAQGYTESVLQACQRQLSRTPMLKDGHLNGRDVSYRCQISCDANFVTFPSEHEPNAW